MSLLRATTRGSDISFHVAWCRYLFNMDHHVRSAEQQDEVYVVDGGPASSIIRYINHRCARAACPCVQCGDCRARVQPESVAADRAT